MDGNRWSSKYIKFILPDILKTYDVLIWVDSKTVGKQNIISYEMVCNLFKKFPDAKVFNIKHPFWNTVQEELKFTIQHKYENVTPGTLFLKMMESIKFTVALPDTCFIVRKNTAQINETFEYCFELMKKYKLKRDQNVYNYAFLKKNVIPIVLHNFTILEIVEP